MNAPTNSGGGTFSNYSGLYIASPTTAVPGAYGLYSAGGKNYFGGNVGIGTTTPGGLLEVNGTAKFDGLISFASGQTFPGTGTITGVTAGSDLTGGGTSGNVTLKLDTTKVPTLASSSNVFTGSVTASSFSGNGSGLTVLNPANLASGTAGISITGNAATATAAASATTATTAGNAANLGGVAATKYARLDIGNSFTGNQSVSGNVSATGSVSGGTASFTGALTAAGTVLPATGTATATQGFTSNAMDLLASSFNSGTSAAVPQLFRWKAEPAGNDTASPSGTLNLLYLSGAGTPGETGLSIASNGRVTFASGQTFPGTGKGTVTSVASGAGLTGGPITTTGTLSIASGGVTNTMLANPSLTVTAGTGLSGGGAVALGNSVTLSNAGVLSVGVSAPITTTGGQTPTLGIAAAGVTDAMLANAYSGTGSCTTGSFVTKLTRNATPNCAAGNLGTVTSVGSGSGLTGGPITGAGTLSIASAGVTDAMLANPYSGVGTCTAGKVVTALARNAAPSCVAAGTVTSVGSGLGLTGGPITSSGTLSIDTSVVPQLGAASNTFSGSIAALSFTGNGSGLTNVNAATATNAVTAATATNANELGGFAPDTYAKRGSPNTFTAPQTLVPTGTATSGVPRSSYALDLEASSWNGSRAVTEQFAWQAEGNEASDTGTLNLLSATGANPTLAETGLSIASNGAMSLNDLAVGITAISATAADPSSENYGISGVADGANGTGVYGDAENGSAAIGVWGMSMSGGYAGEFSGNLDVTGTLTAATKNFKIDDPSDPANKYMYHASVESSEMLNIYSGNVTLDDTGEATVQVPAWLETLNGDFRYQLTCIGGYAPVYIAEEIGHGQFKVAGGKPGMKVSWQVTGVRQDAFARAHPLQVEVEKPANERGYYVHPELYGAGKEKSIQWANHPEQMRKMTERQAKAAEAKRQ